MIAAERAHDLDLTLRERFGLHEFRAGQRQVIENVLQGRDVLCVMPTGGGKSLCYQLPALLLPGLTLVVSPLIALMKDQVDSLVQRGIRATLLNSSLDATEQYARILEIEAGRYDLVYVAPERFRSQRFLDAIARARPSLLAIDEAHCISEWGHDFRPDYSRIGLARKKLGSLPCIALTATATDLVRRDIADQLDLTDPAQFVTGFDRPNLTYAVADARRDADKLASLAHALETHPGPAIVYASSRKGCETVANFLQREQRRSVVVYHAGLGRDERTLAQERFMTGDVDIVVATNAFGMGVDKANIRSVIHYNLPGTLEAYYQEAGRAGRDGNPAHCALLFSYADRFLQEMFIENEYPPAETVFAVYNFLRALDTDPIELTHAEIRESARIDVHESAIGTSLRILEGAGALEKFLPRENMAIVRINAEPGDPSLVSRLGPQAHVQRVVLNGIEGLVNRRFGETVYFHPDELAKALGLDRPALTRAIRTLAADLPIDYVPPFRGNAIRIIDRQKSPRDLEVDFSALAKRKQREYDKLDRMIKYAQTNGCRRGFLLGYFGDEAGGATHCGRCDNCGFSGGPVSALQGVAIDSEPARQVLLKALSGVARARGRFGKNVVAQMLTGSVSEKMDRWKLTTLSTYGILSTFRQAEVAEMLDALVGAGFVESLEVDRFRPVVNLTARGWEYLRGQSEETPILGLSHELAGKLNLALPDRAATESERSRPAESVDRPARLPESPAMGEADAEEPGAEDDDPLRAQLKALRTEIAKQSKQPPYCIFTNETLDLLVQTRPRTPQDLAKIKGLGRARLERIGESLLSVIVGSGGALAQRPDHSETETTAPARVEPALLFPLPPAEPREAPTVAYVPTEEWSCRLVERGFPLEEAAAIRGLDTAAIIRHLTLAARQGRTIDASWFLEPEKLQRWRDWHARQGPQPPPDATERRSLWELFLICAARK